MQNTFKSDIELLRYLKTKPRHGSILTDITNQLQALQKPIEGFEQAVGDIAKSQAFDELSSFVKGITDDIAVFINRYNELTKTLKISEKAAVKYGVALDRLAVEIAKNNKELSISPQLIRQFSSEIQKFIPGSIKLISKNNDLNKTLLKQATIFRDVAGLTEEQSNALLKYGFATEGGIESQANLVGELYLVSAAIEEQTGLVGVAADAMQQLADAGPTIALGYAKSADQIAKAAVQANRLGLSFKEIVGISDKFLDIESSISAELELQLLGGKKINSEKFRQASINQDLNMMSEALTEIIEAQGEEVINNKFQREALAKTLGIEEDKLMDIYASLKANEAVVGSTKEINDEIDKAQASRDAGTIKGDAYAIDPVTKKRTYELKEGQPIKTADQAIAAADIRTAEEKGQRKMELEQTDALTKNANALNKFNTATVAIRESFDQASAAGAALATSFENAMSASGGILSKLATGVYAADQARELFQKTKKLEFNADNITITAAGNVTNTAKPAQDLYVASDSQTVVTGPFGAFQLDPRDSLIAGDIPAPTTGGSTSPAPSNVNVMVKLALGTQTLDQITSYVMDENNRRMNA